MLGQPLTAYAKTLPKSNIRYKREYEWVDAAHFWHLKPGEFFAAPIDDQALMIAFMRTQRNIGAVEEHLAAKKIRRTPRRR